MVDSKLFAAAQGRRFRIQATDRASGKIIVLAKNLSEADCRVYEPSRTDKQSYKYFRVAYADSPLPTRP